MIRKILIGCVACCTLLLVAQDNILIRTIDGITSAESVDNIDAISFSDDEATMNVSAASGNSVAFTVDNIEDITFGEVDNVVTINYDGTDATIVNPFAFQGVLIEKDGADITVTSSYGSEVEYRLTGTATDGSFKIYTAKKFILTLDNLNLTNADGAAINCQSDKKMTLNLAEGTNNTVCDAAKYTTVSGEDMKGTVFSEGKINISGDGSLTVIGLKKHGIVSDDDIVIDGGNITMSNVASDGFHSKGLFCMNAGSVNVSATGDGVDGDEGDIEINGGDMTINVSADTTKGLKCDSTVTVNGGTIVINTSGNVVVTEGDPSYCTAIKCDSTVTVNGGSVKITCTGAAGKGISVDKDFIMNGGEVNITTSGNGSTYTNTENVKDSYSSTCITADRDIKIFAGSVTVSSSGTAGKGISADEQVIIGDGTSVPIISASTTGSKFLVSGSGQNADYANPKAIKGGGNVTINSGNITAKTTQDGGEGIESKNILTINGGTIEVNTYDDGLNASNAIVINGGNIYSYSSGNDGIDSNGTLTINGGVVISSGTTAPEEGFDCDQNTFKITGGILIGTGGSTSTPTSSVCTQRSVVYSTTGTANQLIHVQDASGNDVLTYKIPRSYNSMTLLFSTPAISSATYYIYTGGSVSGGSTFNGYTSGGTYSGGTQATSFTASSMVTTIGGGGGWNPGGGGGRP